MPCLAEVISTSSHDLERALCRFWLRGTCAKGETCEFLHQIPKDVDISSLTSALGRANIHVSQRDNDDSGNLGTQDEFPSLNQTLGGGKRRGSQSHIRDETYHDPSRTRFANAVKRPTTIQPTSPQPGFQKDPALAAARREAMGAAAELPTAIVAPRPSPRIKLRSPTLLPTLPTGESVNSLYMNYRSRALQLGAARNACLSRAADAWRRGDGAAAKRFSREGHELNAKMHSEMVDAAAKLVRERARVGEQAVRSRDASWSDDPGDRTTRGKLCGAGLGVVLGIASQSAGGEGQKATPEERTESMLDLHGLHSSEATEVLEEFLLAVSLRCVKSPNAFSHDLFDFRQLEREHFYGLGEFG